jgi:uncharacterized repeat protein (TIGR03803 family)
MSLVADDDGKLYGTTFFGGICPSLNGSNNINNCGTVFKLTSNGETWTETILYRFTGGSDGANPNSIIINKGALYGTTFEGGNTNNGTIFELTPPLRGQTTWTEKVIYRFCSQPSCIDGGFPPTALIADSHGSFYGTTGGGGTGNRGFGFGTVFKLTPPPKGQTTWTETVLYRFLGGSDGSDPHGLIIHNNVLYGTTVQGGTGGDFGLGTVFKLTPTNSQTTWTETVLYRFTGGSDGANPIAGPIAGNTGALYGTTQFGGSSGYGTIFKLIPSLDDHDR